MDDFKFKILPLLINGHYTDWFFNVVLGQLFMIVRNNIELLLVFAYLLQKFSRLTKTTWDDKISNWFVSLLEKTKSKFLIKGEKDEKITVSNSGI